MIAWKILFALAVLPSAVIAFSIPLALIVRPEFRDIEVQLRAILLVLLGWTNAGIGAYCLFVDWGFAGYARLAFLVLLPSLFVAMLCWLPTHKRHRNEGVAEVLPKRTALPQSFRIRATWLFDARLNCGLRATR